MEIEGSPVLRHRKEKGEQSSTTTKYTNYVRKTVKYVIFYTINCKVLPNNKNKSNLKNRKSDICKCPFLKKLADFCFFLFGNY